MGHRSSAPARRRGSLGYGSDRNLPDTLLNHVDRVEVLPDGRVRRMWFRRTVWAMDDARTGRQSTGRTPGTTGTRKRTRTPTTLVSQSLSPC
ncbi:hypothetical protein GA0070624_3262 [Micromonospora rhizosphaerae]|uniref:Uncharacterized protein n=1 Tax=Micromonospora rhizosphaerae TaxID=568872 RepID=A0A1C6S9S9_9ACTN|nr:hypothetical protein GA0070624_3262 [Micromonospora rhizosphaerae]